MQMQPIYIPAGGSGSGSAGATGATGPAGATGATGANGASGANGGNPNILINTNGKAPINQRQGTTTSGWTANGVYTIDRWKVWGNTSYGMTGGVTRYTVTANANGFWLAQPIENPTNFANKTVTISMRYRTNISGIVSIIHDSTFTVYGQKSLTTDGTWQTITSTVSNLVDLHQITIGTNTANATGYFEFEWVKLEEGSIATPYTIPDPQEELARCQRYFESGTFAYYGTTSGAYAGGLCGFRVTKRTTPTVSLSGGSQTGFNSIFPANTFVSGVVIVGTPSAPGYAMFDSVNWAADAEL